MKSSILIVDDEKLLLSSLKKALSREGYQVLTADCGEEALERFQQGSPDLVLLDVQLPGIDGMQVLKKIKEVEAACHRLGSSLDRPFLSLQTFSFTGLPFLRLTDQGLVDVRKMIKVSLFL